VKTGSKFACCVLGQGI